jgi:glutamine synthetase
LPHAAASNRAIEKARKDEEMPTTLEIPDKHQAQFKQVQIDVSAGKGDDKVEAKFDAELPASLEDAIAAFSKKEVFRRFINAHVVYLQSQERNKIAKQTEEKERKRAPYLESIGL